MVVKILSTSGSFNGVGYNEKKVDGGTAELVSIKNFGAYDGLSSVGVQDYKEYLTQYSNSADEKASRVKNPQFHAIISCEGREYNAKQLKEIAEQYLDKMGYKNSPSLIYFHSDTANNHVHIVSSRVDENGKKINDSFERTRSQAAMKEILMQDMGHEIKTHVDKAMKYNFSSEAQFKLLLEVQGVTVKLKDNCYDFIKYKTIAHQEPKSKVDAKIDHYKEPEKRLKQLAEIFKKYKPALELDKFSDLMKNKFGLELVFHKAQGKDTPYGYTIIDHAKKQVFKGSQVMKLSALLSAVPRADKLKAGGELITLLAQDEKLQYRDFKGQLSKLGFDLNSKGEIKLKDEEQISFSILKERMKQVHYNERFSEAQKFRFSSSSESDIIAKVFVVNKDDLAKLVPDQKQDEEKPIQGATEKDLQASIQERLEQLAQPPGELRGGVYGGILLEHGAAKFEFDENAGQSYYVKLETKEGEVTLWGKELEKAIKEGESGIGDKVGIEYLGKQPETVTSKVKDEAGNWVEKEIQIMKHAWDVAPLNYGHYDTEHSREQERQIVSDKLNSLLDTGKDLGEIAKENNYSFAKKEGETYLVDKSGYAIYNIKDLTTRELDYSTAKVFDLDRQYTPHIHQEIEQSSGSFGKLLDIVEYMIQSNNRGSEGDRKKKQNRRNN